MFDLKIDQELSNLEAGRKAGSTSTCPPNALRRTGDEVSHQQPHFRLSAARLEEARSACLGGTGKETQRPSAHEGGQSPTQPVQSDTGPRGHRSTVSDISGCD